MNYVKFEEFMMGGFIDFAQLESDSELVRYLLSGDSWRDPFKDTLVKKFPKLN